MRLLCFTSSGHPYQCLFAQALSKYGIEADIGTVKEYSDRYLLQAADSIDGINFQWMEYLWDVQSLWSKMRALLGLRKYCRLAKRLGKFIVWTVHNHEQHEGARFGDALGYRTLAGVADIIIVHSRWSEAFIKSKFRPKGTIVVMPHGNFDGIYAPHQSSEAIRTKYGLDCHIPVCGLIGGIRPYRGHNLAIDTIRSMHGEVQLLIAGSYRSETYWKNMLLSAKDCPYIKFSCDELNDNEYAEMVRACDIILLPYQEITGSGALLAAWTLSKAVVTSALPYFREYNPDDNAAGVLMKESTRESMAECIRQLVKVPETVRITAARREAEKYSWDRVIQPVVQEIARLGH